MSVGQCCKDPVLRLAALQRITGNCRLLPGIGDFLSVPEQRQAIQPRRPVVGCIQGDTPSGGCAVCQQSDCQAGRPQSIAVIVVIPDLPDCCASRFSRIFHQQYTVRITDCGIAACYLAVFHDRKVCICRDGITYGCNCFTQCICFAKYQTGHFMRVTGFGIPFIDNFIILIQDLDMCPGQFFAGHDVSLLHADGELVVHE